ncbi:MAG TPA: hypothetical protein VL400_15560 [Polyangiaceae bacterium]|nr:hypothetical protein [Polyangiaceae bacterium]
MNGEIYGIGYDVLVTQLGLIVAGMAAIIGIWVERDPDRPKRYAIWLSALIALATGVGMFQTWKDDQDQKKVEADLARVLQQLDKIASSSDVDIPELNDLLKTELAAQSRANPDVVRGFAQRVADEGGDPAEAFAAYLPESEVQGMQRKGTLAVKPTTQSKKTAAVAANDTSASGGTASGGAATDAGADSKPVTRRRKLTFGGGPARLRDDSHAVNAPTKIEEKKDVAAPAASAEASAKPEDPAAPSEPAKIDASQIKPTDAGAAAKLKLGGLRPGGAAPAATTTAAAGAPKPAPTPAGTGPKLGGLKLHK